MEQLEKKYADVTRAINALKRAVDKLRKSPPPADSEEYQTLRDSEIKRFEICVDTLWKYLKLYLEVKKGVMQSSPKEVFRECFRTQILSTEQDTAFALKMVDARNLTSHIYKEAVAEIIHAQIADYYELMIKLLKLTQPIG